jgi:hypothetical protein
MVELDCHADITQVVGFITRISTLPYATIDSTTLGRPFSYLVFEAVVGEE